MTKHTVLFLAANPSGTTPIALDLEARAIGAELQRSGKRDCFEFVTRWRWSHSRRQVPDVDRGADLVTQARCAGRSRT